jgi:hypothetical protein
MPRLAIVLIVSLLVGVSAGAWFMSDDPVSRDSLALSSVAADEAATLSDRIGTLERELEEERNAREVLEEQLLAIFDQIDGSGAQVDSRRQGQGVDEATVSKSPGAARSRQRDMVERTQNNQKRRIAGLIENGFSEDEALRLVKLESDAAFEVMQTVYEAQRKGEAINFLTNSLDAQSLLRTKVGDAEYERFLIAQGQRTNVQISNILDDSPGSKAGLRSGDEIVSYNGERTYSMNDLRKLTMGGEPGEAAIIEIDRDGVRMQMSIPRGLIGMNGNGATVRGMNWWGG